MSDIKFRPARMIEDNIPPFSESTNGYIWFAIDTGRIYLDTSSERVTVGGNGAAIIYGNFPSSVEPDEAGFYSFNISDLDGLVPNVPASNLGLKHALFTTLNIFSIIS